MTRDWSLATAPVEAADITSAMLTGVRAVANAYGLPQTVWPSTWYGMNYFADDCLLTNTTASYRFRTSVPADAVPGSGPLLTVLPSNYFGTE